MSRHYYSEINLHIVWHAKDSLPLLTPEIEPLTHSKLRQKILNTDGVIVHEIGGTETHVHLAVTIQPTVPISELIGQLKVASSHDVNEKLDMHAKILQWQAGYGVVSFGTGNLEWVCEYIRNQRQHHQRGSIRARLERITQTDV